MKRHLIFLFILVGFLGMGGLAFAGSVTLSNPLAPTSDFATLIRNVITYILGILGAVAVLMFVWAGILFVTSRGEPAQVTKARDALKYAIIGLGIAIAGEGLINLVTFIITGQ